MSNAAVKRSNSGEIIRGGLLSFVFATILVLVFSLIVKLTNMSATACLLYTSDAADEL